jgi:hypothetical protein
MFLGMETNPKGCFLGGMGRGSLVFQGKKVGFFLIFQGIILLLVWDKCLEKVDTIFIFFVFIFLGYGDLMKTFCQENIYK